MAIKTHFTKVVVGDKVKLIYKDELREGRVDRVSGDLLTVDTAKGFRSFHVASQKNATPNFVEVIN